MNTDRLIAEFMEVEVTQPYSENKDFKQDGLQYDFGKTFSPSGHRYHSSAGLKYKTSWDWLIPVIKKLHERSNRITKFTISLEFSFYVLTGLEYCYDWVIKLIKLYNEQETITKP